MKIENNIIRKLKFNNLLDRELEITRDNIKIICNSQLLEYGEIINSCLEIKTQLQLHLISKLYEKETQNIKYTISELINDIKRKKIFDNSFIVVGAQLGTFLQGLKEFKIHFSDKSIFSSSSNTQKIYQIGSINNTKIYINPYLKWDDLTLIEYDADILYNYTIVSIKHNPPTFFMMSQLIEIEIYSNLDDINVLNKIKISDDLDLWKLAN